MKNKSPLKNRTADAPLRELLIEELKDIYNAENQLLKSLPKLAKACVNGQLRDAFVTHA